MNYDIIGDIHGQADKLVYLLDKMGYVKRAGCGIITHVKPSSWAISLIVAPSKWKLLRLSEAW